MPNYDIIPLATDLLDYTIQRVKVKEPQYTKVKAYVMENGQMVENMTYFSTVLPEHEQHQQRRLLEHQWQCQQQQLHQHQRVPPRSDGKA